MFNAVLLAAAMMLANPIGFIAMYPVALFYTIQNRKYICRNK